MKEQLISLETAKLAKEKGFWTLCDFIHSTQFDRPVKRKYHPQPFPDVFYEAPTQSLLQKWLRDKYKIHLTITSISQESWQYHITMIGDSLGENYKEDFYTYEEALEAGLLEALKLIEI